MLSLALSLSLNWFLFIPSLRVAVVKIRSEIQSLWSWVCYQTLSQVSGSLMVSVVAAQARRRLKDPTEFRLSSRRSRWNYS